MLRKLFALTVIVLAVLEGGYRIGTAQAQNTRIECPAVLKGIKYYRRSVWKWQRKLGVKKTRPSSFEFYSCAYAQWSAKKWKRLSYKLRIKYRTVQKTRSSFSHLAGWDCIHQGEGDGISSNGLYYGPLQMTIPWLGYNIRWDLVPVEEVYKIADNIARQHGYSYSWMQGQWPNTFPVCASYF